GLAFAYGRTSAKGASSKTTIDSYQLSGYGTKDFGDYYIDSLAAISLNRYEGNRRLFDGSVAYRTSGGKQYSFKSTAGYKIKLPDFSFVGDNSSTKFTKTTLTPFTSVQLSHLTQDTYSESGS